MHNNIFVALDGEMTSPDRENGGQLIQISVFGAPDYTNVNEAPYSRFSSYIALREGGLWSNSAEAIHGISVDFLANAPEAEIVDEKLYKWLVDSFDINPQQRTLIPVGMNVGSFDMPFILDVLPKTHSLFTRRAVDLNSLCFAMNDMEYQGVARKAQDWKLLALEYGRRRWAADHPMMLGSIAHDAEFDAWVHACAFVFLQRGMRGLETAMPNAEVPESKLETMLKTLLSSGHSVQGISEMTGVPVDFVKGWSIGGRPTRESWASAIERLYLQELSG